MSTEGKKTAGMPSVDDADGALTIPVGGGAAQEPQTQAALDDATQDLSDVQALLGATVSKANEADGANKVADATSAAPSMPPATPTPSADLVDSADLDPVAAKRLSHGLSPIPTDDKPKAEDASASDESRPYKQRRIDKETLKRQRKAIRTHRLRILRRTLIIVVLVLLVIAIAGFWFIRHGLVDDKQAIQGKWQLDTNGAAITITEDKIVLTDDVSYDYFIDPDSKTIVFAFGSLTGNGRYRFSLDQQQLAIEDGDFDWFSTVISDIPWTASALADMVMNKEPKSPDLGENGKLLERVE